MALTVAQFADRFPEFATAEEGIITEKLAEALGRISAVDFGTRADAAQGYLTAHLLRMNVLGIANRLEGEEPESSTYLDEYRRIRREVRFGVIVT